MSMPNKSDKFGIKFRMLTEVASKYVYYIFLLLGALKKKQKEGKLLAEHVVMKLAESIHGKEGHSVTTDNFFTNVPLDGLLLQKKIAMVGIAHSNSKRSTKQMTKSDHEMSQAKI